MLSSLHKKKVMNIHNQNPKFVTKYVAKEEYTLNLENGR